MHSKPSNKQNSFFGLMALLALCFAASAIGATASMQTKTFYATLIHLEWAPPASVFGPVWVLLYALMGIAAWLVWRSGGFIRNGTALGLFCSPSSWVSARSGADCSSLGTWASGRLPTSSCGAC